jgi:hypothetical protein
LSQYENVRGANRYSAGWCGSECHSVQLGGGAIVKAPPTRLETSCQRYLFSCFKNIKIMCSVARLDIENYAFQRI